MHAFFFKPLNKLSLIRCCSLEWRPLACGFREDIEDVIVCRQRCRAQRASLYALLELLTRKIEDGFQQLRALLPASLSHHEQDAGAVLDIAWRKQLLAQDIHDEIGFAAVKAARIA